MRFFILSLNSMMLLGNDDWAELLPSGEREQPRWSFFIPPWGNTSRWSSAGYVSFEATFVTGYPLHFVNFCLQSYDVYYHTMVHLSILQVICSQMSQRIEPSRKSIWHLFTPSLLHSPIFDDGFLNVGEGVNKMGNSRETREIKSLVLTHSFLYFTLV